MRPTVDITDTIAKSIEDALLTHGAVKMPGIGIFEVKHCKGGGTRVIHGKEVETPDYNKLSFRPTASLKRAIKAYAG